MNYMLKTFNDHNDKIVPYSNEFVIDFNIGSDVVKKRLYEFFKIVRN